MRSYGLLMSVVNNKGERRITPIGCDSLSNRQVLSKAITPVYKKRSPQFLEDFL